MFGEDPPSVRLASLAIAISSVVSPPMLALRPMMPFQTVEPVPRIAKVGACAVVAVVALT